MDQPVVSPPAGQIANLVDPPSQGYLLIVIAVLGIVCVFPMLMIRIYVNLFVTKSLTRDDILVFLSTPLLVIYCALAFTMYVHRGFVDVWNIPLGELIQLKRVIFVEELLNFVLTLMIKISVLMMYKRIFVPPQMGHFWIYHTIMAIIAFNVLFYTANLFTQAFSCTPVERVWNPTVPGKCINEAALFVAAAVLNVISDFLILMIPVAVVSRLHMPSKRKMEVLAIFICSILCFICAVGRLVYSVWNLSDNNQPTGILKVGLWTIGELASYFLAACVPSVPPLRQHLRKNRALTTHHSTKQSMPAVRPSQPTNDPLATWSEEFVSEENAYIELKETSASRECVNQSFSNSSTFVSENWEAGSSSKPSND